MKQPEQRPGPASEQARQWNTGVTAVPGLPPSHTPEARARRKAQQERERQRRQDAAQLVTVRWQVRYVASRPGPDKAPARALLAALTTAHSVDAVRGQLVHEAAADGRLALLDRLVAEAADVKP